jgi:hypothetical protein
MTHDLSLRALFAHKSGRPYAVTHRFDSIDLLNVDPPQRHRATDVGNFGMDDPIKAVSRRGRGLYHFDTAMGYEDDLGDGVTLQRWHLNATLSAGLAMVPGRSDVGDWTGVEVGQVVGRTGNSGARLPDGRPMPAHTHIVGLRNGVPFDVERYLLGRPFTTQEDDMPLPLGQPFATGRIKPGVNLRADHTTAAAVSRHLTKAQTFDVLLFETKGGPYDAGGRRRRDWVLVRLAGDAKDEPAWAAKAFVTLTPTALGRRLAPPAPAPNTTLAASHLQAAAAAIASAGKSTAAAQEALK